MVGVYNLHSFLRIKFFPVFTLSSFKSLIVFGISNKYIGLSYPYIISLEIFFLSVDAHYKPLVAATTGKNHITSGITINEAHLIPGGRNGFHEVNSPSRSIGQVVGSQGEMLYRALEKNGSCQGIYIAGYAMGSVLIIGVIEFIER